MLGVVVVAQCVALYLPGEHGPSSSLPVDKLAHLLLFATVAAVAVWAGVPWPWVAVLLVAQAGLSELVQQLVLPDRGGEIGDLLADLLGTGAGLWVGRALVRRRTAHQMSSRRGWW